MIKKSIKNNGRINTWICHSLLINERSAKMNTLYKRARFCWHFNSDFVDLRLWCSVDESMILNWCWSFSDVWTRSAWQPWQHWWTIDVYCIYMFYWWNQAYLRTTAICYIKDSAVIPKTVTNKLHNGYWILRLPWDKGKKSNNFQ